MPRVRSEASTGLRHRTADRSFCVLARRSIAEFPEEMEAFRGVLLRVDEYNAARLKLTAEMADQSNTAKTLVIKAEDARILGDFKGMKAAYAQLYTLNQELLGTRAFPRGSNRAP